MKRRSLRQAINETCKQCIADPCSPGTWKQQVTLCGSFSCPLFEVRPRTSCTIPESVLRWHDSENGFNEHISSISEPAA